MQVTFLAFSSTGSQDTCININMEEKGILSMFASEEPASLFVSKIFC